MNIYAFRLPGKEEITRRKSDKLIIHNENDIRSGFVFSPFFNSDRIFKVVEGIDIGRIPNEIIMENEVGFPKSISSKQEHKKYIENIISSFEDSENSKVVAARTLKLERHINIEELLEKLSNAYPDAFVFMVSTKEFGTWIGASPELLIEREGNNWKTVALAGTRPRGLNEDWDFKNISEQKIVADYIKELFNRQGLEIKETFPGTVTAGPVEHIKTQFSAIGNPKNGAFDFIAELSPTPALCGYPKQEAIKMIKKWEGDSRRLYGGFIGWYSGPESFRLYVNLRSALVNPDEVMLYAGGGIMKESNPEDEWNETERKLSTLLTLI